LQCLPILHSFLSVFGQDLNYDLENNECWASLLKEPEIAKKKAPDGPIQFSLDEDEDAEIQIPEMYLDMPVSWTAEMFITPKEYKMRFPGGAKIFEYNDAMVERAAPYSQPDGMVQKVLQFNDDSRKASNLRLMDERFDKRVDLLIRRKFKPDGRIIHEFFGKGRPDSLKGMDTSISISHVEPDLDRFLLFFVLFQSTFTLRVEISPTT